MNINLKTKIKMVPVWYFNLKIAINFVLALLHCSIYILNVISIQIPHWLIITVFNLLYQQLKTSFVINQVIFGPGCELSGVRAWGHLAFFPAPYPFIADLKHLGEEEQQQVGPGLSVAFWGQGQEVCYSLAAHATAHRQHTERNRNINTS